MKRKVYMDDLSLIPMSVFIKIYTGKGDDIAFAKGLKREQVIQKLVDDYNSIIGEKNIRSKVMRKSQYLNHFIRLCAARYAKMSYDVGDLEYCRSVLKELGYRNVDDKKIKIHIASVIASESFSIDKERDRPESISPMTETDFVKERVALMRHYKMHIDMNAYSAKEYAYLVKTFCEEIEYLRRQKELMKLRRK